VAQAQQEALDEKQPNVDPRPSDALSDLIRFTLDPQMFPATYQTSAEVMTAKHIDEATTTLLAAMAKYPECVIHEHLDHVYVAQKLVARGVDIGGSYSHRRVYLSWSVQDEGLYAFNEQTFHHELASVLRFAHQQKFPKEQWLDANGSKYGDDALKGIKEGRYRGRRPVRSLMQLGYTCDYSQSDLDNDFSNIAAELFLNRPGFWQAVEESPLIAKKVDLAIEFYSNIDPIFDQQYFRSLPSRGQPVLDDNEGETAVENATEGDHEKPEPIALYSNDQIAVMTQEDAKAAITRVANERQAIKEDSERGKRLKREFELLMGRLRIFDRVQKQNDS
jgi:hypothetical protein